MSTFNIVVVVLMFVIWGAMFAYLTVGELKDKNKE